MAAAITVLFGGLDSTVGKQKSHSERISLIIMFPSVSLIYPGLIIMDDESRCCVTEALHQLKVCD